MNRCPRCGGELEEVLVGRRPRRPVLMCSNDNLVFTDPSAPPATEYPRCSSDRLERQESR